MLLWKDHFQQSTLSLDGTKLVAALVDKACITLPNLPKRRKRIKDNTSITVATTSPSFDTPLFYVRYLLLLPRPGQQTTQRSWPCTQGGAKSIPPHPIVVYLYCIALGLHRLAASVSHRAWGLGSHHHGLKIRFRELLGDLVSQPHALDLRNDQCSVKRLGAMIYDLDKRDSPAPA